MIVETNASDIGYGGMLKQKNSAGSNEQLVRFTSGVWNDILKNIVLLKRKFCL